MRWAAAMILTPVTLAVLDQTGKLRLFAMTTATIYVIVFVLALINRRR